VIKCFISIHQRLSWPWSYDS